MKKKSKLFWILLIIALISLAVLYGFVIKKRFVDTNMNDVASGEGGVSGANIEAVSEVYDSGSAIDAIVGGSGGGSGGDADTNDGGIVAPPVIPDIE